MHSLSSLKNPHSRPLPQGWSEHFDTERKFWYYVDLDSIPPRVSLVHPADDISQGHNQSGKASISSRPLPIVDAAASGNSCDNVQTNGTTLTSAQRLYATAMTSNSCHPAFTSQTSVPIPEVSIGQHPSLSACSTVHKDATPDASPTQAPPPTSVTENPEGSQPRYRPGRPRQSRQMAHPFLSLSPFSTPLSVPEGSTGQTLYNPAVQTSTSGPNFDSKSRFKPQCQEQGPKVTRDASLGTSHPEGLDSRRKVLPPIPADGERSNGPLIIPTMSNSQHTNLYSGITEDNIFLSPAHGTVSSTEQRAIIIHDELPLLPLPPPQSGLHQPVASSSSSRPTDQVIFQPRPIKPLRGLNASFQDQIRETSQPTPSLEEDQHKNIANRARKTPLFRRFSVGFIKAEKSEPDKDIRQDNHRSLDTSLDESFVLVNDVHF